MSAAPAPAPELAAAKAELRGALRHVADFPQPGIDFVDIMPLFAQPALHARLLDALARQVALTWGAAAAGPEALVGLDARGFLFGPGLALRLGLPFVAVRKKGKLPGPCVAAEYVKEYGVDVFEMQSGALRPRQRVLVVDDIIATGMSSCSISLLRRPGAETGPSQAALPRRRPIWLPSSTPS